MLDIDAVNLAKAIRQHETGNRPVVGATGETTSRYQFLPSTWQSWAGKYLGDKNAPLTLENENKVAYSRIKEWKDQGFNPGQIASLWNSGSPDMYSKGNKGVGKSSINPEVEFNVPKYVNSVYSIYKQNKVQTDSAINQTLTEPEKLELQSKKLYTPNKPADVQDTAIEALGKAASNIPSSAWNFVRGVAHFLNPLENIRTIANTQEQFAGLTKDVEQGVDIPSIGEVAKGMPEAAYETLIPDFFKQVIGATKSYIKGDISKGDENLRQAQLTITNDPFNQYAPIVFALKGVKDLAKGKQTAEISKDAKVSNVIEKGKKAAVETTKTAASLQTGLNPATIAEIVKNPEKFTPGTIEAVSRDVLTNRIWKQIESKIAEISSTGKAYEGIRSQQGILDVNSKFFSDSLKKYGLDFEGGKIKVTRDSKPINNADLNTLQQFFDRYLKEDAYGKTILTANEFLNAREFLKNIADFNKETTKTGQLISKELYSEFNRIYRPKIKDLSKLDEKFSVKIKDYNQIKKDLLLKDSITGEIRFKDNAVSKIVNSINKGRESLAARLEAEFPGILDEVRLIKAIEDIQNTSGNKIGTYLRGGTSGYIFSGGNPIAAIIGSLLGTPAISVYLLRMFGQMMKVKGSFVEGIITKMKEGKKLTTTEQEFFWDMVKFASVFMQKNVNPNQ